MIDKLVAMYKKGALTPDHMVMECVHIIDPANPEAVLGRLPNEILERMLGFAKRYHPTGMVSTHGLLPTADQVDAAKVWIEKKLDESRVLN